jgi:hypothetical protein
MRKSVPWQSATSQMAPLSRRNAAFAVANGRRDSRLDLIGLGIYAIEEIVFAAWHPNGAERNGEA